MLLLLAMGAVVAVALVAFSTVTAILNRDADRGVEPTHQDEPPPLPGRAPAEPAELPYHRKHYLLDRSELAFFRVLVEATPEYVLCPKVRMSDFLYVKGAKNRQAALNRIHYKHVDFLVCRQRDLRPLLAIELDGRSHSAPARKARDAFVDAVYAAAGFPVLHVQASREYSARDLRNSVESKIRRRSS